MKNKITSFTVNKLVVNSFGFESNKNKQHASDFNYEVIQETINFLKMNHISESKTYNKIDSYALKHIVERYIGAYVSNGDLIASLVCLGFQVKPNYKDSPNALGKFSFPSKTQKSLISFKNKLSYEKK
jgi:hypothetical protein